MLLISAMIIILACLLTLGYHLYTGVPPFPSTQRESRAVIALLSTAKIPNKSTIYELGCGWGTLITPLAKNFPNSQIIGIEISPLPWLISKIRTRKLKNVTIFRKNFFKHNLNDANAIISYLMIPPMVKLAQKLDLEITPNTPAITVAFYFKNRHPTAIVPRNGLFQADVAMYLWPATSIIKS